MRRLRAGRAETSPSLSCFLSEEGFEVPNRHHPGCFGFPDAHPITRPWRNLAQATGPQLVAAKVLIVNYTFGTGSHYRALLGWVLPSASRLYSFVEALSVLIVPNFVFWIEDGNQGEDLVDYLEEPLTVQKGFRSLAQDGA